MKNSVRHYREASGLSQQALAEATGTSQQQIARIETGQHAVKLDMALRIASALGTDLAQLYPEARELLETGKRKKSRDELVELHYDPSSLGAFDSAGLDLDPATWMVYLRLRGGTKVSFTTSTADARRLQRNVLGRNAMSPFVVFKSSLVAVAVNLDHLLHYHELWDAHTPTDWHDNQVPEDDVAVWFSDSAESLSFSVPADVGSPDDEEDAGQLRHILFVLQSLLEPDYVISFMDADGENAFFRTDDIALLTIPLRLLDPRLDDALYKAEYAGDDTGAEAPIHSDDRGDEPK